MLAMPPHMAPPESTGEPPEPPSPPVPPDPPVALVPPVPPLPTGSSSLHARGARAAHPKAIQSAQLVCKGDLLSCVFMRTPFLCIDKARIAPKLTDPP